MGDALLPDVVKVAEDFTRVLTDMRSERTRSKVAAKRAVKIRAMVHDRVGSIDVNLREHVLGVLGPNSIPADVIVDNFSCRGKLWKKGNIHRNWNLRWFTFDLRERRLSYFVDETTTSHPKGTFLLEEVVSVKRMESKDHPHAVDVATRGGRTFHFEAETEAALNVWLIVLDSIAPLAE